MGNKINRGELNLFKNRLNHPPKTTEAITEAQIIALRKERAKNAGRPQKGSERKKNNTQKATFILKTENLELMKEISIKETITISALINSAIELLIKRYNNTGELI